MLNVAVIGCGYWGPNLMRNFVQYKETSLIWTCDTDINRMESVLAPYPGVKKSANLLDILNDDKVDAVAVATPVFSHFSIARQCLESGKHVLIEKPLAASVAEGEILLEIARRKNLQIMCDHTFCYTGIVQKMKEIIESGQLGDILYFDSVRINFGLFQEDVNVVWDLAPHDLSMLDFLTGKYPVAVNAHGMCHANNGLESMAYITLHFDNSFISHFHLNWLSPVKIRKSIISGSKKMMVWNDMDPAEKLKIYEKGITVDLREQESKKKILISYRSGDMYSPNYDQSEALSGVVKEFSACIKENRPALTDGEAGLRVVRIIESMQQSLKNGGQRVDIAL